MTEPWLTVKQGDAALLVSFPHTGLSVPAECAAALVSFPLARHDALEFVREKREILVIEEKRGIIESQFKEYFYDYPGHKPEHMAGKSDENYEPLVPWVGEL